MVVVKPNEVSVSVVRKTRTTDGAGGFTIVESAITGSPFACRLIRRTSTTYSNIDAVPGDMMLTQHVLVFPASATVQIDDICTIGTDRYRAIDVRSYARTVQVDIEAVA
jgi:hypothetical protein